jgi:hypothetical protein
MMHFLTQQYHPPQETQNPTEFRDNS